MTVFDYIKRFFKNKSFPRNEEPLNHFSVSGPTPEIGKLEPSSATWIFINAWAGNEIESLRKKNDNLILSEQQTTVYRAQIKLLKRIIALPEENEKQKEIIIS